MRKGFNIFDRYNWEAIFNKDMFWYVDGWDNAIKLILIDTVRNKRFSDFLRIKWK